MRRLLNFKIDGGQAETSLRQGAEETRGRQAHTDPTMWRHCGEKHFRWEESYKALKWAWVW